MSGKEMPLVLEVAAVEQEAAMGVDKAAVAALPEAGKINKQQAITSWQLLLRTKN
jgi:hypothetical protein